MKEIKKSALNLNQMSTEKMAKGKEGKEREEESFFANLIIESGVELNRLDA